MRRVCACLAFGIPAGVVLLAVGFLISTQFTDIHSTL